MKRKLRVALLFGGKSAEHEISLISARNIAAAINRKKYEIVAIAIDKQGRWFHDPGAKLLSADGPAKVESSPSYHAVAILPGNAGAALIDTASGRRLPAIDVVFPVLHGPFGEDGTVQGLLKSSGLPFVGAGVLGSAAGMDKDVMKRLLREQAVPIAKFLVFDRVAPRAIAFASVKRELGLPFFVKPANLGSSVGIGKVHKQNEFHPAITEALRYDSKIIIEENIAGREIECSVLGNENPIASLPGEIITGHDFYSYDAKYLDAGGAQLIIPAKLAARQIKNIQALAIKTFKLLCCEGMARVDFFVRDGGGIFVNEINTIPGFTQISMYPKMWEASGVHYAALIDRLIALALERSRKEQSLRTSR